MFRVVQHDERTSGITPVTNELIERIDSGHEDKSGRRGDPLDDLRRRPDRGKFHPPRPVWVEIHRDGRDLQRETGLARSTRTGQSDQPLRVHQVEHCLLLGVAPNERRQRSRQVVRRTVKGAQRRERRAQVRVDQLPHVFRTRQITQPGDSKTD